MRKYVIAAAINNDLVLAEYVAVFNQKHTFEPIASALKDIKQFDTPEEAINYTEKNKLYDAFKKYYYRNSGDVESWCPVSRSNIHLLKKKDDWIYNEQSIITG